MSSSSLHQVTQLHRAKATVISLVSWQKLQLVGLMGCPQNVFLGRLNAEAESNSKENAGKLLAHIGRSRVSPLTAQLPHMLQPVLEKAFAAQQGSQLKQVTGITCFLSCQVCLDPMSTKH